MQRGYVTILRRTLASPAIGKTSQQFPKATEAAERKIAELTAAKAPATYRAHSLPRRPDDAPTLPLPPLYHAIMAEISRLIGLTALTLSPADEALLDTLADVAMVYERASLPGWLFSDVQQNDA